jgi:type III pantothenate kinase
MVLLLVTLQFQMNRLVIDAGTCVTYDFIDDQDNYRGGAISQVCVYVMKSLHAFTARLPLLVVEDVD